MVQVENRINLMNQEQKEVYDDLKDIIEQKDDYQCAFINAAGGTKKKKKR